MKIFHGGTNTIINPLANAGRKDLDFGQGFYVTDNMVQAQKWAERMSRQRQEPPLVNIYEFDKSLAMSRYKYLTFDKYDIAWLDFIASCRTGNPLWMGYDCIEGGIANDRVIDTVEGYIAGTIDAIHALAELSKHQPNNQICLIGQDMINECVTFKEAVLC